MAWRVRNDVAPLGIATDAIKSVAVADAMATLGGIDLSGAGQICYLNSELDSSFVQNEESKDEGAAEAAKWVVLLRERGHDASVLVRELVRELRQQGLSIAGFVQVPRRRKGEVIGYEVSRLAGASRKVLARRVRSSGKNKNKNTRISFRFESPAFTDALGWLQADSPSAQIVVIDGSGALEGRGAGHYQSLVWALRLKTPKVIIATIRRDQYATISQRLGLGPRRLSVLEVAEGETQRAALAQTIVEASR